MAEERVAQASDSTLTNIEGFRADDANLTVTIDRSDLETAMGRTTATSVLNKRLVLLRHDTG